MGVGEHRREAYDTMGSATWSPISNERSLVPWRRFVALSANGEGLDEIPYNDANPNVLAAACQSVPCPFHTDVCRLFLLGVLRCPSIKHELIPTKNCLVSPALHIRTCPEYRQLACESANTSKCLNQRRGPDRSWQRIPPAGAGQGLVYDHGQLLSIDVHGL